MWEFYIGLIIAVSTFGFIYLARTIELSDSFITNWDKLQNTSMATLKVFFVLMALMSITIGYIIAPQVVEVSQSQDFATNSTGVNQTALDSMNNILESYEVATWSVDYAVMAVLFILFVSLLFMGLVKEARDFFKKTGGGRGGRL